MNNVNKYCEFCGAKLEENANVCLSCGRQIKNTRSSKSKQSLPTWLIVIIVILAIGTILNIILGITQVIGIAIAVIMLIVLAIKYISAAPSDKAEIKKSATAYIVGAVVLFAASGIIQIIKNFATEAIGDGN